MDTRPGADSSRVSFSAPTCDMAYPCVHLGANEGWSQLAPESGGYIDSFE